MPPRRATRSSAATAPPPPPPATRTRKSANQRVASPVEDSLSEEEEVGEDSILGERGVNVEVEEEEEEDVKPVLRGKGKGRASAVPAPVAAASAGVRAKRGSKAQAENTPSEPAKPTRATQPASKGKSKSKSPPADLLSPLDRPSARRSSRLSMSSAASEDSEAAAPRRRSPSMQDGQDEDEEEAVVKKEEGTDDVEEDEEEEDEEDSEDEEPVVARRGAKGKAPAALKGKKKPAAVVSSPSSSESEPDLLPAPSAQPARASIAPTAEESEEEGDLTIRMDEPLTPMKPSTKRVQQDSQDSVAAEAKRKEKEGPKKRLVIHKMVLVNFKSYQGRQEIGPFHKSFSAIVGPNGSGKSNTIDALLFVFGYRASKMRQGKLSELIHNSAGYEGLESCAVEVWFREIIDLPGPDSFLLVPNSQLVVARTAYRNNSSKYTINDRTSTFTEVTTLLKARGIDLDHKRFLILQGEVESIAQMKPKAPTEHEDGLLEYLEDIIGTSKYKEPIEEAQVQVDALNEQRGDKLNRLRLVEKEKGGLEAKKREAEDYLRNTNELTRKKSMLAQFHMHTLRNNIDINSKQIERFTAELAAEQDKNASNIAEIEETQKSYDEKLEAFEEVKHHMDALTKDSKKYEKEEVGLSEKKKHLTTKQKKLKKSINDDGHARSEAASTFANYEEQMERTRNNLDELEHKLVKDQAELEEVVDSLKGKTDEFTNKIEAKQLELEPWTAKISEKQSAVDIAESERKVLAAKADGVRKALDEATANLAGLKEGETSKRSEHAALKKEMLDVEKQLATATKKLDSLSSKSEALRSKVANCRQKADDARASLTATKSEGQLLSTLNKLKEQGRLKGYHGRLGDLGVIDDKYDVAVTTAVGRLNNIVTDTVEQGQACMEHLRKANAGRANIICLDKLPNRGFGSSDTPEGVPRLFDLVKPKDPKFAIAFYFAIRDTLVADNMEQAKRIAFGGAKRWRVVTLQGGLVEASGTMSGGGTRIQRGGMSSKFASDKVEPAVVARYEKESAEATQELHEFSGDKKAMELEVATLSKRIPEIEMSLEKIELDLQTSGKRIADAQQRLAEAKSQSKPDAGDEKRIKVLESEIASSTKEIEKLRSKSSTIEEQIKELQNKILEIGGVKLRAMQSKVTNTKELIQMANEAITKAEVGQAKAQRDAEKLEKAIATNTAALEKLEVELEEVTADHDACKKDLAIIQTNVQEAQDAMEAVQESLAEAKAELDEKLTSINTFRAKEMEFKQQLDDCGKFHKDCQNKLKHWQVRNDELELVQIDEDDEDEDEEPNKPADSTEAEATGEGEPAPLKKSRAAATELEEYSADELKEMDKDVLNGEIVHLEEIVGNATPNLNVLAEYRKREAEFLDRAKDLEGVTGTRDEAKKRYDDLRKLRLEEFMTGFSAISSKLKEMYQMITLGGNAELELVDSMDPFSEGIIFSVMPPKKSWKNISNLSGGEKTLSSLALVFALHVFKPTPLYFMDEIDAALDFRNVSIIANYIKSKTEAAQFIIISLRNDMFELSHRLVGIYKTSNCTKSIAIDNKDLRTQGVRRPAQPQQTPRRPIEPTPSARIEETA